MADVMINPKKTINMDTVNCYKCLHYYITWDKNFPYGCQAVKAKSKRLPSAVVLQHSGSKCLMFEEKQKNKTFFSS